MQYISKETLDKLLNKQDLSLNKNHAIGLMVHEIKNKLEKHYQINADVERGNPIVDISDNYYNLGYDKNEITLSERYTKYISDKLMLRTQMSSVIPNLLRNYKRDGDKLYICPGLVYRRDVRDKTHVGEPHQMDIWMLTSVKKNRQDLLELVGVILSVLETILKKKIEWRYVETNHNYTDDGIEVEIKHNGKWLEVLECGLISEKLLEQNNLKGYSGLALGLGLERLVMIVKSIDDIRILQDERVEINSQMKDLKKYKIVSNQPSTKRDMSIAVDELINEEELTEKIIEILSEDACLIEEIKLISETKYEDLPDVAKERLGINVKQKNVLLRILLRDLVKSIPSKEANDIYTRIYHEIHEGSKGYKIVNKIEKEEK